MAERVGFEPTGPIKDRWFSSSNAPILANPFSYRSVLSINGLQVYK